MNGLVLYIGLGLGLALAAGVRPFLPALLAGALASSKVLGVSFAVGDYTFLYSGWWLAAVAVGLVLAYLVQWRLGSERFETGQPAAVLAGIGIGVGALLFAGTLAAHNDVAWPGLIGGAGAAALAQAVVRPLSMRTRARLPDRGAREAVTIYLDSVSLALAALVALLHPLGYVAVALFAWLWLRMRARSQEKYAGLRILRR
ncbi:MAG TPA: hypothetical protein VNX67_08080 [Solirubrobacteraceae bacterium]|jgi:hypothetical protein|nr:hypothetical protein [Solirubrobacteraceae bacterium]